MTELLLHWEGKLTPIKMFYEDRIHSIANMTLIEQVRETLDSGDPIVRKWTLIESNYLPFLLSFMYVIFVKTVGPFLMKNRKPFDLRKVMILYNFLLVITYFVCVAGLFYVFFTTDAISKVCYPAEVKRNHYTYFAASAGWIIYLLKYIEFADTVFFVLRKKDHLITNLHVIHHAALPIIGWFLFRSEKSGFQFVPGVTNSIVHIVMYTYYGLAAIGPEVQKYLWWKEHLTKFQMLQFIVIIFFVLVLLPLSGCKATKNGIYIDIFFALVFLALFWNFYMKTYGKSPRKKNAINGFSNSIAINSTTKPLKVE
ncbi:elongation of very long chain fatty acids protein AAEL008004 [Nephila pilipes]|uniref:Elongation of very long chain fatty acids protein n=1 Tax=Nephila pilipes TaxID=299642 RepID=A0A8X6TST5_NEPPI|nr:elongation of very long chain fatty acids protein AAEL008004 [Nephila pilipes]